MAMIHPQLQSVYGAARKSVGREQMVPLLYRGTHQWIQEALACFAEQRWDKAADRIFRAQTVLRELLAALDHTAGREVADSLASLYVYWIRRLTTGLDQQNPAPLHEVAGYLDDLAVAWAEAARRCHQERCGGEPCHDADRDADHDAG